MAIYVNGYIFFSASGDVTVGLSPCGWCWVVTGRRVLAWARSQGTGDTMSPSLAGPHAAKELTLPQTDLAHKADLVSLFYEEGSQVTSQLWITSCAGDFFNE